MRVALSAGEKSGEVIAELLEQELVRPPIGCEVVRLQSHTCLRSVFGFTPGLGRVAGFGRVLSRAEHEVVSLAADVVVLISFSGLHLPLGRRCRQRGLPVLYLGPPQFWAWGQWRVPLLRGAADKVVCLFTFEESALRRAGVDAVYVGYPLLDVVRGDRPRAEVLEQLGLELGARYLAFMPGSRNSEVAYHRPLFRAVFEQLRAEDPGLSGVMIAEPDGAEPEGMVASACNRYDIIRYAEAALAVSGTATAECAILGTPLVACYHLPAASRIMSRLLVRVPFFALPNILAGRQIVPEYLEPSSDMLVRELRRLIDDTPLRAAMLSRLKEVSEGLGPPGAISRIGRLVVDLAQRRLPLA